MRGGWRSSYFRIGTEPDKNPFAALARALEPLTGERGLADQLAEVQKLAERLAEGSVNLTNVIAACRAANPGKRVLLIADQFEEVFTLVPEEALRDRFIGMLLSGFPDRAYDAPPDFCLLLILRADFYGMAMLHRPLSDALQDRVVNLGPMTRDELREAITRPAGRVAYDDGLVDTLLDDVASQPGSLPLLQFALREMWGRRQAAPRRLRRDRRHQGCLEAAGASDLRRRDEQRGKRPRRLAVPAAVHAAGHFGRRRGGHAPYRRARGIGSRGVAIGAASGGRRQPACGHRRAGGGAGDRGSGA